MGCKDSDRKLRRSVQEYLSELDASPLTENDLRNHVWPMFSRVIRSCRERGEIYLANHSLGRPLDHSAEHIKEGLDLWYSKLDSSWDDDGWPSEIKSFRAQIAKLIGVSDPSAVVPKSSAGQGLRAVLNALPMDGARRPLKVVSTTGEFDSIDFILKTYAKKDLAEISWVGVSKIVHKVDIIEASAILQRITEGIDLVVVSIVMFGTGQILQGIEEIIKKAHKVGAMVLLDVYHAAGVIPISLEKLDADFMIGGSYKYARGGPGACWLAINPKHLGGNLRTLDTGWFAKEDPFGFERQSEPELASNGDAWMESTPSVLPLYQARAGLELMLGIGIERLREYNLSQQQILREAFGVHGVPCFCPDEPRDFGGFALLPNENARELSSRLRCAGVNTDARGKVVRFGPDILNSEQELYDAAKITAAVLNG